MSVASMVLQTSKPFSFEQNLAYLKRSANECMFQIDNDYVYKAISSGQHAALLKVGAAADDHLSMEVLGEYVDGPGRESLLAAAEAYTREWFDLDRDLTPFYALAESDPLLKEPMQQFYGLRLMGIPDLFEALSWGIIGQQINLAFAYTLKRRFVEQFGQAVERYGKRHWLFPKPELIATLRVEDLEPLRMTVKKCEYLIGAAGAIVSGELSKERLIKAGGLKEAEKLLTNIRGVGPWTAHYAIMRCLRRPDAFPIDDVGLHNAIKLQLGMDRKPEKAELLQLSAGWTGWEAYATFYLWRLLY